MAMSIKEIGEALVNHCKNGTEAELQNTLYADDAVSVEAMPNPETGKATTEGLDGIRGKHTWWNETMEAVKMNVHGPYPHGDSKFAVIFNGEAKTKADGKAFPIDEVAVYTVADGKIVREEFFYDM